VVPRILPSGGRAEPRGAKFSKKGTNSRVNEKDAKRAARLEWDRSHRGLQKEGGKSHGPSLDVVRPGWKKRGNGAAPGTKKVQEERFRGRSPRSKRLRTETTAGACEGEKRIGEAAESKKRSL